MLLRTTADSVDLSNLRFDKSLQLYVKARNMHGSSVTSDPIEFTPTDVYINIGDANIFVDHGTNSGQNVRFRRNILLLNLLGTGCTAMHTAGTDKHRTIILC